MCGIPVPVYDLFESELNKISKKLISTGGNVSMYTGTGRYRYYLLLTITKNLKKAGGVLLDTAPHLEQKLLLVEPS